MYYSLNMNCKVDPTNRSLQKIQKLSTCENQNYSLTAKHCWNELVYGSASHVKLFNLYQWFTSAREVEKSTDIVNFCCRSTQNRTNLRQQECGPWGKCWEDWRSENAHSLYRQRDVDSLCHPIHPWYQHKCCTIVYAGLIFLLIIYAELNI